MGVAKAMKNCKVSVGTARAVNPCKVSMGTVKATKGCKKNEKLESECTSPAVGSCADMWGFHHQCHKQHNDVCSNNNIYWFIEVGPQQLPQRFLSCLLAAPQWSTKLLVPQMLYDSRHATSKMDQPVDTNTPETLSASAVSNGADSTSEALNEKEAAPPAKTTVEEESAPLQQNGNGAAAVPPAPEASEQQQSAMPINSEVTTEDQATFPAEDEDMGEVSEVFEDEPMDTPQKTSTNNSPKRGRRNRKKATVVSFQSNQKSYWSSDDDSMMISSRMVAARPRSPKPNAATRAKKPRSKRRIRRAKEDEVGSSSDVEQAPKPQRMAPPLLTVKTAPSPPVSVVRTTKNKTKGSVTNSGPSSNQTNSTATNSPIDGPPPRVGAATSPALQLLSIEDTEIFQRLDDEYETALEERHIGYMARYTSVRQAACFSVVFMLIFLSLGTFFFKRYADWTTHDSLLFSIYTITTVGYGNQAIPKETGFQIFTILYIFVGIATLTIMVGNKFARSSFIPLIVSSPNASNTVLFFN